jgi:hypothetical protein
MLSGLIIMLLRANAYAFSAKIYKLQLQLIVLLMAQILSPTFFVAFPVVYAIIMSVILQRISLVGGDVGILLLSVYALNNALMTIIFVSP